MSRPPLFLDLDGPLLNVRDRYHGVYAQIAEELSVPPLDRDAYWSAKRRRAPLEEFFLVSEQEIERAARLLAAY